MTDQTQTTTEPVLLPCPFCGGEAWLNDYEAKHSDLPPQSRAPQCRSCGVSPGYLPTAKKAIAAWNTRTTPQPLAIGLDRSALTGDKGRKLALRLASEQVKPTTHEDACCCGQCMAHETALDTAKSTIKAILALAALAEGWQGIETAPKDGTRMCVAFDDCPDLPYHWEIGRFSHSKGWVNTYGHPFSGEPTHWFIPAAPTGGRS